MMDFLATSTSKIKIPLPNIIILISLNFLNFSKNSTVAAFNMLSKLASCVFEEAISIKLPKGMKPVIKL